MYMSAKRGFHTVKLLTSIDRTRSTRHVTPRNKTCNRKSMQAYLVASELEGEEEEGDLSEGRLHPVPRPRANFEERLEVLGLRHVRSHCAHAKRKCQCVYVMWVAFIIP